jgi:hypothetical protein
VRARRPRPEGLIDRCCASAWLCGAVRAGTDKAFALVMTEVGAAAMQVFLDRFAATLPKGVHAALMLDGAVGNTAGEIVAPAKVNRAFLPPCSLKLGPGRTPLAPPVGRVALAASFQDLDDIIDGRCNMRTRLITEPGRVASLNEVPDHRLVSSS